MGRQLLTDEQTWVIVCSPHLDSAMLGNALAVKPSTIRNARARFRHTGFSCRVAYVPCQHCGRSLTQRGFRTGRSAYHQGCRVKARRIIQNRLDRARWQRMSLADRDHLLAKANASDKAHQTQTHELATNAYARWSDDDDAYLIAHWDRPAHRVADEMGRSLYAIRARRHVLRARGQAPPR